MRRPRHPLLLAALVILTVTATTSTHTQARFTPAFILPSPSSSPSLSLSLSSSAAVAPNPNWPTSRIIQRSYPQHLLHATGSSSSSNDDRKKKQQKEKDKLAALMAKQEREAVKKYLDMEAKKDALSQAKIRAAQQHMADRAKGGGGKDAPWSKASKDGSGGPGAAAPQPPPPKKKKFQQISLTCRQFSIDDVQDVTFEGSHLTDVPFLGLPEVAVFGRSNVGKSSLLNCLTGNNKKVAVVSKTPGRTQQINLFKVHDSNGPVAVLVDLPGYGYAKLPKALQSDIGAQVRQYLSDRPTLRLAVLLMDSRRDPQKSDLNMMKYFRAANVPLLVLGTKVDKLKLEEIEPNLGKLHQYFKLPEGMPVPFSSVTGLNKRAVWNAIRDACVGEYLDLSEQNGMVNNPLGAAGGEGGDEAPARRSPPSDRDGFGG